MLHNYLNTEINNQASIFILRLISLRTTHFSQFERNFLLIFPQSLCQTKSPTSALESHLHPYRRANRKNQLPKEKLSQYLHEQSHHTETELNRSGLDGMDTSIGSAGSTANTNRCCCVRCSSILFGFFVSFQMVDDDIPREQTQEDNAYTIPTTQPEPRSLFAIRIVAVCLCAREFYSYSSQLGDDHYHEKLASFFGSM